MLLWTYGGDHYSHPMVTVEEHLNGIVNKINSKKKREGRIFDYKNMVFRNLNNQQ
jgi:hypothetical protein